MMTTATTAYSTPSWPSSRPRRICNQVAAWLNKNAIGFPPYRVSHGLRATRVAWALPQEPVENIRLASARRTSSDLWHLSVNLRQRGADDLGNRRARGA